VFPFDTAKLAGYLALVAVRLQRPAEAGTAFAHSLATVTPAPKQAAVLTLELAELRRQQGDLDEALTLASQALAVGRAHASERVIAKARRFRRGCPDQPTPALRTFDQRLRETVPA
jgi:Tetratricopeptide repeat